MKNQQEIIVIGGGVIGVSVAHYLRKTNRSVTLLEKGDICSGASHGNAGLFSCENPIPMAAPGVIKDAIGWMFDKDSPFSIKPRLDLDLLRWLLQFNSACRTKPMLKAISIFQEMKRIGDALIEELTASHNIDCGMEKKGRLILYRDAANFEKGVKSIEFLKQFGINVQVLDKEAVRKKEPNLTAAVVGGLYYSEYIHVIPGQFVHGLADVVEQQGGTLKTNTEVIGFETKNKRISKVITNRGDFYADQVILAAGAWSPIVARDLGIKVPIQPAKGYSITVKRPETCPGLPLSLADDKVAVTPMGDSLRFSSTLELAGYDLSINRRRIASTRRAVNAYLPGMENLELIELWSGLRPNTPDTLPLIGRSESFDNLIMATGHDVLGMTHALITGKIVSQIVANEAPVVDISPFRPERFN
ncbi:MAG: FAD-dependent oxidoreductase [SAR324 cluster bacterium]|uniref:FAD-dependent oxidoreductase n=1 Tax=SAR324 cluster bacterium TaxID=2024889 RepID=A0A2A4SL24_9DELT|nr:MAG: FAD-dependent oxidoreductase [SAR324 cluster bacterium]